MIEVGLSRCRQVLAKNRCGGKKKTWPCQLEAKDAWTLITSICPGLTATTAIPNEHTPHIAEIFIMARTRYPKMLKANFSMCLHKSRTTIRGEAIRLRIFIPSEDDERRNHSPHVNSPLPPGINHILLLSAKGAVRRGRWEKNFNLVTHGNLSFLSYDPDGTTPSTIKKVQWEKVLGTILTMSSQ